MPRGTSIHAGMPLPSVRAGGGMEQTVTIINNSGKIVNTGKQLVSLFKEVSNSYKDKKAELKLRRFLQRSARDPPPAPTVPRSTRELAPGDAYWQEEGGGGGGGGEEYRLEDGRRARHAYDEQSVASSRRSHRSRHNTRSSDQHRRRGPTGQGLTENNLDRLSEAASSSFGTAPSRATPGAYRSPYAETIQPGTTRNINNGTEYERSIAPTECTQAASESLRMQGGLALQQRQGLQQPIAEEQSNGHWQRPTDYDDVYDDDDDDDDDDMHLAYGSLPPDLAHRKDLEPVLHTTDPVDEVAQAQSLVHRIEDLLDEVECMEHTATEMIRHLQERPDAAAAVALTLAELSAFVGKLSPGFLSVLKGGSPAVFALLASPQFLIGTGIAVGVTVVMFGGWKIIQRATTAATMNVMGGAQQQQQQEAAAGPRQALAFEANPAGHAQPVQPASAQADAEAEEALVLKRMEEELSSIESWRRGIVADSNWEKESAEMELITPKAKTRSIWGRSRDTHKKNDSKNDDSHKVDDNDDTKSHRSSRTHKSSRSSSVPHKPQQQQQQQQHPHKHSSSLSSAHAHAHDSRRRRGDDGASVASSGLSRRSLSVRKPPRDSHHHSLHHQYQHQEHEQRQHGQHGHEDRAGRSSGKGAAEKGAPGGKTKEKERTGSVFKSLFKSKDKEKEKEKEKEKQGDPVSA